MQWNRDVLEDELFTLWRLIAYTGMRRSEALAAHLGKAERLLCHFQRE